MDLFEIQDKYGKAEGPSTEGKYGKLGHITLMEVDHKVISSVVTLPLPLIQGGQLLVSGKSMCTSTC